MCRIWPKVIALALATWALVDVPAATAQEYCVVCSAPSATYRCVIEDARPGLSASLQMSCVTALAEDGQHGQCAVKRAVTVFECDGPIKKVSAARANQPADMPAAAVIPTPVPVAKSADEPPATVAEAAKRAKQATDQQLKDTGEQLQKAGEATGSFFKKTLSCIGSLFTRCSS
jgi:hypothetical protein